MGEVVELGMGGGLRDTRTKAFFWLLDGDGGGHLILLNVLRLESCWNLS